MTKIDEERVRVKTDPDCIMQAAFVSFKTRWGAAVRAQTQQSRNPTVWLTECASEPRDIYWNNLAIPYVSLTVRKLIASVAFFFLTIFFMIPITIVQSLANIEGIEKRVPFLKWVIELYAKLVMSQLVFYLLQEAMMKDTLERAREPNLNLKAHLQNAYVHPVFKNDEGDEDYDDIYDGKLDASVLVPTKRQSRRNTPAPSKTSSTSSLDCP